MDQDSFRAFYDKTMPMLRAYAIRCSGAVDLADDVVQEAFLRLLRSAPATLTEAQTRAYLYRTVEHLIVNRWHAARRQQKAMPMGAGEPGSVQSPSMTTDMERAFAQLDSKQRSLLWLAYVEGFDHKEIAAAAKLKEKSVRVLLFRARQTLMEILRSAGLGPEGLV